MVQPLDVTMVQPSDGTTQDVLSLDLLWEYRIQHGTNGPFMSHLATQLGYSAGEFQALQLIVLAAFGVVD